MRIFFKGLPSERCAVARAGAGEGRQQLLLPGRLTLPEPAFVLVSLVPAQGQLLSLVRKRGWRGGEGRGRLSLAAPSPSPLLVLLDVPPCCLQGGGGG